MKAGLREFGVALAVSALLALGAFFLGMLQSENVVYCAALVLIGYYLIANMLIRLQSRDERRDKNLFD